jgi:hypothetical protein
MTTRRVRQTMADRKKADTPPTKPPKATPGDAPKGHPQDVSSALVRFLDALTDLANTISEAVIREGDQ